LTKLTEHQLLTGGGNAEIVAQYRKQGSIKMHIELKAILEQFMKKLPEISPEDGLSSTAVMVYKNHQLHFIADRDTEEVKRRALELIRGIKPEVVIMIAETWIDPYEHFGPGFDWNTIHAGWYSLHWAFLPTDVS
jgi:hypothetical protein